MLPQPFVSLSVPRFWRDRLPRPDGDHLKQQVASARRISSKCHLVGLVDRLKHRACIREHPNASAWERRLADPVAISWLALAVKRRRVSNRLNLLHCQHMGSKWSDVLCFAAKAADTTVPSHQP